MSIRSGRVPSDSEGNLRISGPFGRSESGAMMASLWEWKMFQGCGRSQDGKPTLSWEQSRRLGIDGGGGCGSEAKRRRRD